MVAFSTIYSACEKTLASIGEILPVTLEKVELVYPVEDDVIVRRFRETIERVRAQGKKVRLAMFDTVLTFPGARFPWEMCVKVCKELGVLSLIDGAHGIGEFLKLSKHFSRLRNKFIGRIEISSMPLHENESTDTT